MVHEEINKFIINFFVSGTVSVVAKTIMAPVERMKLILQNQDSALQIIKGEHKPYKGIMDIIIRIPKEQGFRSFWRGNGANLLRVFPSQAFGFAFYDMFKFLIHSVIPEVSPEHHWVRFASGGLAGTTTMLLTYPMEFCQTRLATDVGTESKNLKGKDNREFHGLGQCITKVYKIGGVRAYYDGAIIQTPGIFIYRAIYFGLFDYVKTLYLVTFPQDTVYIPMKISFALAQSCTVIAGFIAYPFDTVGRRLMLDSTRPDQYKLYRGMGNLQAIKQMYRKGGIRFFYKGELMNIFRGVGGALILVFYDQILYMTNWKKKLKS